MARKQMIRTQLKFLHHDEAVASAFSARMPFAVRVMHTRVALQRRITNKAITGTGAWCSTLQTRLSRTFAWLAVSGMVSSFNPVLPPAVRCKNVTCVAIGYVMISSAAKGHERNWHLYSWLFV